MAVLLGLVALGAALRLAWLFSKGFPIDSDHAVIGLMARHILNGARPLLYYGQLYYGPVDAYLDAGLIALLGSSRAVLHILPLTCALLFIPLVYRLGREAFSEPVGLLSAALAALSPVFLTERGVLADAAYSLTLLLGTLSLLWALRLRERFSRAGLAGLLALWALGFYIFPLMSFYIAAVGIFWLVDRAPAAGLASLRGKVLWAMLAAGAGLLLVVLLATGRLAPVGNTLARLAADTAAVLMGFAPPLRGETGGLAGPLWALRGLLGLAAAGLPLLAARLERGKPTSSPGRRLLGIFTIGTLALFGFFAAGIGMKDELFRSPRYLFPLYSAIPLWAHALMVLGGLRPGPWLRRGLVAGVLALNLASHAFYPGFVTPPDALADWFRSPPRMRYVYTDYWTAYWLAFETDERVIPAVIEGRNRPGLNRYEPYGWIVEQVRERAFLYALDDPARADFLAFCVANGVSARETLIAGYAFYDAISPPVGVGADGLALLP